MQEEKQNINTPPEINNNPQRDNTTILLDIKGDIYTITGIVFLMFLLQLGIIVYIILYGIPIVPVWY